MSPCRVHHTVVVKKMHLLQVRKNTNNCKFHKNRHEDNEKEHNLLGDDLKESLDQLKILKAEIYHLKDAINRKEEELNARMVEQQEKHKKIK